MNQFSTNKSTKLNTPEIGQFRQSESIGFFNDSAELGKTQAGFEPRGTLYFNQTDLQEAYVDLYQNITGFPLSSKKESDEQPEAQKQADQAKQAKRENTLNWLVELQSESGRLRSKKNTDESVRMTGKPKLTAADARALGYQEGAAGILQGPYYLSEARAKIIESGKNREAQPGQRLPKGLGQKIKGFAQNFMSLLTPVRNGENQRLSNIVG